MSQEMGANAHPQIPWIAAADAGLAVSECGHAFLVRLLGGDANDRLVNRLASFATTVRPKKRQQLAQLYENLLGPAVSQMPDAQAYVPALIASLMRERSYFARLAKDATWRPRFAVRGADQVQAARDSGRGVVFWSLPQVMNVLLLRLHNHDNGWGMLHMSHWMHGQSTSRLGHALFNQRDCRIEDQFSGRIMMTEQTTKQALKTAATHLKSGGCVSFRGIGWSNRPMYFPFFDGHMHLAFGAPVLARRSGAALFTVSAQTQDDGFVLGFDPMPIARSDTTQDIGTQFVHRVEATARAAPTLWSAYSRQWKPGAPPVPYGDRTAVG